MYILLSCMYEYMIVSLWNMAVQWTLFKLKVLKSVWNQNLNLTSCII